MTEPVPPSGPASAPPPSAPRWQRRVDARPGVVDSAAAQRLYDRVGGWAIERISRAGELAARRTSAGQVDAAGELPLAGATQPGFDDAPVDAPRIRNDVAPVAAVSVAAARDRTPDQVGAAGPTTAASVAAAPPSIAATSVLATRLQRRAREPGMVKAPPPTRISRETAVSLRTDLHARLAARGAVSGPSVQAARHTAPIAQGERASAGTTRGHDLGNAPSYGGTIASPDPVAAPSVGSANAAIVARAAARPSSAPQTPANPALVANAMTLRHTSSGIGPLRQDETGVALPRASAEEPFTGGPSIRRAPTPALARAAEMAPAPPVDPLPLDAPITAAAPLAAPPTPEHVPQAESAPLTLARMPETRDVRSAHSVRDDFAAPAASVLPAAAPIAPNMIWRKTENVPPPAQPARIDHAPGGVLMRAATPADVSALAPPPQAEPAAAAVQPDLHRLAEQVTRLIVRRLEIESERRGARRWN